MAMGSIRYIFLDDERYPVGTNYDLHWFIARNMDNAVEWIETFGLPKGIYFDHDLGYNKSTGYDFAKWLTEYCLNQEIDLPAYYVHSMNPIGADNIRKLFKSYQTQRLIPNILSQEKIYTANVIFNEIFKQGLLFDSKAGTRYIDSKDITYYDVEPIDDTADDQKGFVFLDNSEIYFSNYYSEWIVEFE